MLILLQRGNRDNRERRMKGKNSKLEGLGKEPSRRRFDDAAEIGATLKGHGTAFRWL